VIPIPTLFPRNPLGTARFPRILQEPGGNLAVTGRTKGTSHEASIRRAGHRRIAVGRCARSGESSYRTGHSRCTRAAGGVAWLPGGQPIRPMSVVPGGSAGTDGQHPGVPRRVGREHLPHLLVRLLRPGQRRAQHLGRRTATPAAATAAAGHQFSVPALVFVIARPRGMVRR
jgi:hypothetical protein